MSTLNATSLHPPPFFCGDMSLNRSSFSCRSYGIGGSSAAADDDDDEDIMVLDDKTASAPVPAKSDLAKEVQALINLIFDTKMMESTVSTMEYDIRKNPLGPSTPHSVC